MARLLIAAAAALALGLAGGALLGGCGGSGTKTVSVAATPTEPAGATATDTAGTGSATAPPTTTRPQGGTQAPATTRSAPEPAFTRTSEGGQTPAAASAAAAAVVRAHGYTPNDTSEYHSGQTLGVLVGTRTGSGDGYGQQAFFFVNGRYIGTDASEPSATLRVVSQSDTAVTLAYPLYRHNDPLCCPGAGTATVHFQLNNGRLQALDPIPPAHSGSGVSRF
jgi:LppP/LprE lipoprotein